MRITWLGHSGFRIEIDGATLLIDPWLDGNPMFPPARRAEALAGATHILLTPATATMRATPFACPRRQTRRSW